MLDASRAVGVVSQLKSSEQREAFAAENRTRAGAAAPRARGRGARATPLLAHRGGARGGARRSTGRPTSRRSPSFRGVRVLEDVPLARDRAASSTGRRSSRPGSCGAPTRGSSRTPTGARKARELFDDAQADAGAAARRRAGSAARAGVRLLPRERGRRRHRGLRGRGTRRASSARCHTLRQQSDKGGGEPNQALADFVAPRESGLRDWIGAFAVTTGLGAEALVAGARAGARRLRGDHGQGARRPPRRGARRSGCTARRARDWGYGAGESLTRRGADPRALPRHPAGARLSRPAPTTREKRPALRPAGRRGTGRHRAHRELRDAARGLGLRLLLRAPAGALLRARHDRAATRCSTTTAARAWTCARSSAGSRRTSTTTRREARRWRARCRPASRRSAPAWTGAWGP